MKHSKINLVLITLTTVSTVILADRFIGPAATQGSEKPAEQVYRNIQVFKGLPATQLIGAMNFMAGSMGVSCNHCHVPNQFAKDDKPAKQTARQHLQMTRALNDANFEGKTVINCVSCHRGAIRPDSALRIATISFLPSVKAPPPAANLPTVEEILTRHLSAMGGRQKLESLRTVKMTGSREMRNGADAPTIEQLEVYRKAPNKLLMNSGVSTNNSTQAFNGSIGWRRFNGRVSGISAADLVGARHDAEFFKNIKVQDYYASLKVIGVEEVGGRDAFVIEGRLPEAHPARMFGIETERLYFDVTSGLLIRRYVEYKTVLGLLPEVTDYTSFRKVNGLMFPFEVRLSRPPLVVSQKFAVIKVNEPIDDAAFEKPEAK